MLKQVERLFPSIYYIDYADATVVLMIGPNGPLPREIIELHPNAPHIKRNGEVNAWDNEEFRKAVKATGKKQIIIAGITTDVSIAPPALYNELLI